LVSFMYCLVIHTSNDKVSSRESSDVPCAVGPTERADGSV